MLNSLRPYNRDLNLLSSVIMYGIMVYKNTDGDILYPSDLSIIKNVNTYLTSASLPLPQEMSCIQISHVELNVE